MASTILEVTFRNGDKRKWESPHPMVIQTEGNFRAAWETVEGRVMSIALNVEEILVMEMKGSFEAQPEEVQTAIRDAQASVLKVDDSGAPRGDTS